MFPFIQVRLFIVISISLVQILGWNFPEDVSTEKQKGHSFPLQNHPSPYDHYIDDIISRGITNLTLSINRIMCNDRTSSQKNIIFSPISIAGALALVLLGSIGSTENEISKILGIISGTNLDNRTLTFHEHFGNIFNKLQRVDPSVTLTFANGIFVQDDFRVRETYKQISKLLYKSEIVNLNFKTEPIRAQHAINSWVSTKTRSKIIDILNDAPPENTKLIITNALYFKGQWEFPFAQHTTARRPFYINGRRGKENVMVNMMANNGYFQYYKDFSLECEIIRFPYKGDDTAMYVVMPFNTNIQVLKHFENSLTTFKLESMIEKMENKEAVILFPKMQLDSSLDLKSTFSSLGMHSLFDPYKANLASIAEKSYLPSHNEKSESDSTKVIFYRSKRECKTSAETFEYLRQLTNVNKRLLKNPGLYVDEIIHKTYMDITETGTEAAAATSISLTRSGGTLVFRADAPFLLFIRDDRTKLILFWGTIYKPTPNF